jgi:hypothetical protein
MIMKKFIFLTKEKNIYIIFMIKIKFMILTKYKKITLVYKVFEYKRKIYIIHVFHLFIK